MEELRTGNSGKQLEKKDNVPVVVGSEYQDTKIQRMVHFIFMQSRKKEVGILNPTFTMLFKYKGQLLVGAVTNDVVLIFTGQFF